MRGLALGIVVCAAAGSCGGSGAHRDGLDATTATDASGRTHDAKTKDATTARDANGSDARDGGKDASREARDASGSDARGGGADGPKPDGGVTCLPPSDHTYHVQTTTSVIETGSRECPFRRISSALAAIGAAHENLATLVTVSIDSDLDPISQGPNEFPIDVPIGIDIVGGVEPVPTITVPSGTGAFSYSYRGPTTSPGKDGGHLENLSLIQAGGPSGPASGITIQNTYVGALGTNQEGFAVQLSGVEVQGFDRGIDVETNGNVLILDGTVADANNDGLHVASGFATVTPKAAAPVHFDENLAFGVHVEGSSGLYFEGVHTAAGGRSITVNDNVAGGVSLYSSNNLYQYLWSLELRRNPIGALVYLQQAVSIIDDIIADNGIGIDLLPADPSRTVIQAETYLGSNPARTENQFSGNAPDLCVAGGYYEDLSIWAANNTWSGGRDCVNAPGATLTVDRTGCTTATNLGFMNYSAGFTNANLVVSGCVW